MHWQECYVLNRSRLSVYKRVARGKGGFYPFVYRQGTYVDRNSDCETKIHYWNVYLVGRFYLMVFITDKKTELQWSKTWSTLSGYIYGQTSKERTTISTIRLVTTVDGQMIFFVLSNKIRIKVRLWESPVELENDSHSPFLDVNLMRHQDGSIQKSY